MKNDKLLQHQLRRLTKLLQPELNQQAWGTITLKGERIVTIMQQATLKSLKKLAHGP